MPLSASGTGNYIGFNPEFDAPSGADPRASDWSSMRIDGGAYKRPASWTGEGAETGLRADDAVPILEFAASPDKLLIFRRDIRGGLRSGQTADSGRAARVSPDGSAFGRSIASFATKPARSGRDR
jgi:hypothetical protein